MRDYEELVNSLKSCIYIPCNEEKKEKCLAGKERDCRRELMAIAANAIEELQKALDVVNDAHNEGYDVGYWAGRRDYEPKWISVEEAPAKKVGDEGYTGYLVFSDGYMQVADYTTDKFDNTPYFHVDGEYDPGVTHWMPLPEPPKENKP